MDENSAEAVTKTGEPKTPLWALTDDNPSYRPVSEEGGIGSNNNMGWKEDYGQNLKVNKTPETAEERQIEKAAQDQNRAAAGAEDDGQDNGTGLWDSVSQSIADNVAEGVTNYMAPTVASIDEMLGVTGTPDELQTAVDSAANADMYGIFLEFTSYGQPGAKAQRTIFMEEMSRWSGKTYLRSVRHTWRTGSAYLMQCKVRAPGSLGGGATGAGAADGLDNEDAAKDGATVQYEHQLTAEDVSDIWAGRFNRVEAGSE